jgi:signal transduction histidine kinase
MRDWRTMRGRFVWRIGCLLLLMFLFAASAGTLVFWLVATGAGLFGEVRPTYLLWRVPIIAALVFAVFILVIAGRALRRAAAPVGELMEAAGRIEAGDYSARVGERGPREVRALVRAFNAMAARLEMNDEQRRNLLADVTHELRTPLTVIQGNLEGLLDGVYPRDDAHLAMLLDETRVFSRLVEDLRTLAQAEGGTLKLQREMTDLSVLVGETVASFATQADEAGVSLRTEVGNNVPALYIDPVRIRAVLSNLIVNALRYTPREGDIRVRADLDTTRQCVRVAVTDTGKGIPADILPHIFDRFYKSSDSGGSGLGLAIARHLVNAHGGDMTAESAPGSGATISFTLPIQRVHSPANG